VAKADAVVGGVRDAGKAQSLALAKISIGFGTASAASTARPNAATEESDAALRPAALVAPSWSSRGLRGRGEDGTPHMLALAKASKPSFAAA